MKRLFILLFMFSLTLPAISAQPLNSEMKNIVKDVKVSMDKLETEIKTVDNYKDTDDSLVNVIFFRQDLITEGGKSMSNNNKECVAIAIDEAWALASKKCRLSKGDNISPDPGTVKSVSTGNFRIIINDRAYKVANYETKHFILLRAIDENGNPLFLGHEPNLAYVSAEYLHKDDFLGGTIEVNRTDINKAAHDTQHNAWEDNFHPYYDVGRTTYPKTLKSFNYDKKAGNLFAKISTTWIGGKDLRAGDPLFYVEKGKRYLLGFGYAINLWDNFENVARTDKVLLFTHDDIKDIFYTIRPIDLEASNRIIENVFIK